MKLTRAEQRELDRLRDVVFEGQLSVYGELGMKEPRAGDIVKPSRAIAGERTRGKNNCNDTPTDLQLQLYE